MTNLTPQEQTALHYYQSNPYSSLSQEHQQYYAYLMQKVRIPATVQTATPATKKLKKPKGRAKIVRKSDGALGAWVFGAVILLICLRFIYNEYQKPPRQIDIQPARVVYKKRR